MTQRLLNPKKMIGGVMTLSPFAPSTYPTLPAIKGVQLSSCHAGIRYKERHDMMLMQFSKRAQVAGVYTRSLTAAAPVEWCRHACEDGEIAAILVNSGNANAFTGERGLKDTETLAKSVADALGCSPTQVMICSTGVIGEFLPVEKMLNVIPELQQQGKADSWQEAAKAIMTTDTFPKMVSKTTTIGAKQVTINGIAKGSGMIAPNMATMLGYMATDASIPASILKPLLSRYTMKTFNSITVDSDTSTNDTVLMVATGAADTIIPHSAGDPILDDFKHTLFEVMKELALLIVKDGEGATKFVTYHISGAEDDEAARQIGLCVANSPLVKTAIAASDPNWGRLVAAAGKSGEWLDPARLSVKIGNEQVTEAGAMRAGYSEANAKAHMQGAELHIFMDMGVGEGKATIWGCDFTEGYIRINANYRS